MVNSNSRISHLKPKALYQTKTFHKTFQKPKKTPLHFTGKTNTFKLNKKLILLPFEYKVKHM